MQGIHTTTNPEMFPEYHIIETPSHAYDVIVSHLTT